MNNIIDQLFQKVQTLGNNFTANTYQALSSAMGPVFTLMLTLYIIFWGYQFWQGRGGGNGAASAFRLFRMAAIYAPQSSPHFSSLVCLPCEYALKLPKSAMLMSFRGQSADLA